MHTEPFFNFQILLQLGFMRDLLLFFYKDESLW